MLITCLWSLFFLSTLVQIAYWVFGLSGLLRYRPPEMTDSGQPGVSIIICARNEAENLKKNLGRILNQNYRSFEVLVVDDHSSDKTSQVVLDFQKTHPILHLLSMNDANQHGKKAALSKGIECSQFENLLLTDADCAPASLNWLSSMQCLLQGDVQIGIGYGPYTTHEGFLNAFIRFETSYTAIQYLSFAIYGLPYMAVGRNLIYRKSLFFQQGGFRSHAHVLSGDDDLFVNGAANARNTAVTIHPDTFVFSEPKRTWRGYYNQKSRHLTTGRHYRLRHRIALGGLSASHALHYVSAVALLTCGAFAPVVFFTWLARMGVVLFVYGKSLRKLQDPGLLIWVPLFDAVYVLYYFLLAPALIAGNGKQWK
ncbi:MAG: glycosyltransferase [Saprospiraceae bacterium]|nr:glycosyltransferase [Saprospiraceae bacterium]